MRARAIGRHFVTALLAFVVSAVAVHAAHTPFLFRCDRFEVDGNQHGPHDGTPDIVNEFDDGSLAPDFYNPFGTAYESGGHLVLTNPGAHAPSPFGGTIDFSLAASSGLRIMQGGSGDGTATSYWEPLAPSVGKSYHMTLFVTVSVGGFQQIMGIGIANRAGTVEFEQHRTDLNQSTFQFQNQLFDFQPFDVADITGPIGLRLDYDDGTKLVTGSFSLDGGATWTSPFPARQLSDMAAGGAQLLLSADPEVDGGTGTTTTTAVSTTTTTTLVPGSCSAVGCRRTLKLLGSKLVVKDKATNKGDSFAWKFRRGDATDMADFGDPLGQTSYEFCLGDATGAVLMQATVPGGATCGGAPCWKSTRKGFKYTDPDKTFAGVRKMLLRPGPAGASQVLVKGRGENLSLPTLPLANLPVTARLRASDGACWANVFGVGGVGGNIAAQFVGKGD